jgi:CubicO group peptidase (beta-lactamase class C family)
MADLTFDVPITPTTMFDIGSTSKQFTAASIVLLANEGKLSLTDDIRKYVPEVPDYGTPITIDHMLRHISGLRDYNGLLFLKGYKNEDATGDDEALDVISRQRALNFAPGTQWDYSNTGFFLAAIIVKRVSGKTLAEFAKERFFVPLGMTKTNFRDDHTVILTNRATAYDPKPNGGGFQIDMSNWDQLGDGAINTNVVEMAKWDENFYTGKVGGRALIDKMYQRGTLNNGDSVNYARGLFIDTYRGVRNIQHGGAWAGYRAMLMRFPEQHLSIAVLCNRSDANTTKRAQGVADVVLGDVLRTAERKEPKPQVAAAAGSNASAPGDVSRFPGLYYGESKQSVVRITEQNGKLNLGFSSLTLPLKPQGGARFVTDTYPITVDFGTEGLSLKFADSDEGQFKKVTPATPSASDWNQLAGTYYSPELDASWKIVIKDGKGVIVSRGMGEVPLEPTFADAFTAGPVFLRFGRDGSGQITGFEISASRMQKIRFERR